MNKAAKSFSFSLLLASMLQAECLVDYSVMYLIAKNEMHEKRDIGYPYLISFNNPNDSKKAKEKISDLNWLDGRTVDCKGIDICENTLASINLLDIYNLDLGAYQINQKWYFFKDKNEYFNLEKSYNNACRIVYGHYEETGTWDWKTIARYHSKTPEHNKQYAERLKASYIKIKGDQS
ncbi:hypothetical protein [Sulfurimonas sp.]|uniref:hypothetical protein n=1 Tax=Sulfurimonas sp. TaxID=2022749 RepID=UPI0025F161F0|nr:hypothetical protein [Sulfurimonas sp.]MBW6487553.1 hypothetical protein [Sulfurimonas sp.]